MRTGVVACRDKTLPSRDKEKVNRCVMNQQQKVFSSQQHGQNGIKSSHAAKKMKPNEKETEIVDGGEHLFNLTDNHRYEQAIEFVKSNPQVAGASCNNDNQTPLHILCSSAPSTSALFPKSSDPDYSPRQSYLLLIETLVRAMGISNAILIPDQRGRTPLYLALHSPSHDEIVEALLRPYQCDHITRPSFTKKERKTSLHVAISVGCSVKTILNIARTFPKYVTIGDYKAGNTPLHLAALNVVDNFSSSFSGSNQQELKMSDAQEAKTQSNGVGNDASCGEECTTNNPCPYQVETNANEIIGGLLRIDISAASLCNKHSQLPLHLLCYVGPTSQAFSSSPHKLMEAIGLLVRAFPDGLLQKDGRGYTPIDYVRLHGRSGNEQLKMLCRGILECCYAAVDQSES